LLPLPYNEESLQHVVVRIQQVQDYLKRQILIENISSYLHYESSTMPEYEFLRETAQRSGCGILLDVNNIYVSATNLGSDPEQYIANMPTQLIQEIHLAGAASTTVDNHEVLIDSHNQPVTQAVWELYRKTIQQLGIKPTLIEWDTDLPPLETLCLEATCAETIMRENYVPTQLTG
jgi:uncharacterized protein (UPF0276 family)